MAAQFQKLFSFFVTASELIKYCDVLAVAECNSKVNLHQFVLTKGDFKKKVRLAKGKALGSQTSLTLNNTELKQATFLS